MAPSLPVDLLKFVDVVGIRLPHSRQLGYFETAGRLVLRRTSIATPIACLL